MVRVSAIFIAVCMVLIAGSLGIVLHLSLGFDKVEASVVGIAALTGMALFNAVTTRARDRADIGDQIADLSRGTADLARQVAELGRRVIAVEKDVSAAGDKARAAIHPVASEIELLGTLVKQLADSVAAHESVLVGATSLPSTPAPSASPGPPIPVGETAKAFDPAELGEADIGSGLVDSGRFAGMDRNEVLAVIRQALDASRLDLYLQPVVTLPQRKVRYYEAVTRLRTDEGELLLPVDYLGYAESGGLMPMIDNLLLLRCVQVVRRLLAKNREIGLFCNISGDTLIDSEFFPQFSEFMQANRALASSLVFEFSQSVVRAMGPMEFESLAALADLGFRFSMDHVVDLRLEPRDLAERCFRFIKIPAALLLDRNAPAAADIHPADLSDLLGRYGIDLIAEKIESESTVVDLLDFDVRFGQGFLFSPPKPVRTEVLQEFGDRPGIPIRHEEASAQVSRTFPEPAEAPAGHVLEPATAEQRPSADRRGLALAQLARGVVRRA